MDSKQKVIAELRSEYIKISEAFGTFLADNKSFEARQRTTQMMSQMVWRSFAKIELLQDQFEEESDEHDQYKLMIAYLNLTSFDVFVILRTLDYTNLDPASSKHMGDSILPLLSPLLDNESKMVKAIHACIKTRTQLCAIHSDDDPESTKKWCLENLELYATFIKNHSIADAWDARNAFGITNVNQQSDMFKKYHNTYGLQEMMLENYFHMMKDGSDLTSSMKYSIGCLPLSFGAYKSADFSRKLDLIRIWTGLSIHLINKMRFKRANQLLSIGISRTVNLMRDAKDPSQRVEVKKIQAQISMLFASMGESIAKLSLYYVQNEGSMLLGQLSEVMKKSNAEVLDETELMDESALSYLTQTPMEILTNIDDIKKLIESSLSWCKRQANLLVVDFGSNDLNKKNLDELMQCILNDRDIPYPLNLN